MAFFFTNLVNCSLGVTGSWQNIDLSASVPVGTTGVCILVRNTDAFSTRNFGLRKNGSTDDRHTQPFQSKSQTMFYVGVDGSRICQGWISNVAVDFWLVGYFTTDAVFFDEGIDKTTGSSDVWETVDCSAVVPAGATALIFEIAAAGSYRVGLRKFGSTDDLKTYGAYHKGAIIGCDADRKCDYYRGPEAAAPLFLLGYLTEGTFYTAAVDKSIGVGAYTSIDISALLPAGTGIGALIQMFGQSDTFHYGYVRQTGSTDDFSDLYVNNEFFVVGVDASSTFQGYIGHVNIDFFVLGVFGGSSSPVPDNSQIMRGLRWFNNDTDEGFYLDR